MHHHTLTRRSLLLPAVALTFLALLAAQTAQATQGNEPFWADFFTGYRYGQNFREPHNPNKITKNIFQMQMSAEGLMGGVYNFEILRSCGSSNPKRNSTRGATEYRLVYHTTIAVGGEPTTPPRTNASSDTIINTDDGVSVSFPGKPLYGFIRNAGMTMGYDLSTKNDALGRRTLAFCIGPAVYFNVPGYFYVGALLVKENNRNAITGRNVYYHPTYCLTADWSIPIKKTPIILKGSASYTGCKGKDGFGNKTAPETFVEAAIMLNPFLFFKNRPRAGKLHIGLGWQYWNNKHGSNVAFDPTGGSRATGLQLLVEAHL